MRALRCAGSGDPRLRPPARPQPAAPPSWSSPASLCPTPTGAPGLIFGLVKSMTVMQGRHGTRRQPGSHLVVAVFSHRRHFLAGRRAGRRGAGGTWSPRRPPLRTLSCVKTPPALRVGGSKLKPVQEQPRGVIWEGCLRRGGERGVPAAMRTEEMRGFGVRNGKVGWRRRAAGQHSRQKQLGGVRGSSPASGWGHGRGRRVPALTLSQGCSLPCTGWKRISLSCFAVFFGRRWVLPVSERRSEALAFFFCLSERELQHGRGGPAFFPDVPRNKRPLCCQLSGNAEKKN